MWPQNFTITDLSDLIQKGNIRPSLLPSQLINDQVNRLLDQANQLDIAERKLEKISEIHGSRVVFYQLKWYIKNLNRPSVVDSFKVFLEVLPNRWNDWTTLLAETLADWDVNKEEFCLRFVKALDLSLELQLIVSLGLLHSKISALEKDALKFLQTILPSLKELEKKPENSVLLLLLIHMPELQVPIEIHRKVLKHFIDLDCDSVVLKETNISISDRSPDFNLSEFLSDEFVIDLPLKRSFPIVNDNNNNNNSTNINNNKTTNGNNMTTNTNNNNNNNNNNAIDKKVDNLNFTKLNISLASVLKDFGYAISYNSDLLSFISTEFAHSLNPIDIGRVIEMMSKTSTGLVNSIHPNLLLNTVPSDALTFKTWNIPLFVSKICEIAPDLNWDEVLQTFNNSVSISSESVDWKVIFSAYQSTTTKLLPTNWAFSEWKNKETHFLLLKYLLQNSHKFSLDCKYSGYPDLQKLIEELESQVSDLKKASPSNPSGKNNSSARDDSKDMINNKVVSISQWKYIPFVECLLKLSEESGFYQKVIGLFEEPLKYCPELLLLTLGEISSSSIAEKELLYQVLYELFFNWAKLNVDILNYFWKKNSGIFVEITSRLYKNNPHRISQICSVLQKMNILEAFLNHVSSTIFGMDLVLIAEKQNHFNLTMWFRKMIKTQKIDVASILKTLNDPKLSLPDETAQSFLKLFYKNRYLFPLEIQQQIYNDIPMALKLSEYPLNTQEKEQQKYDQNDNEFESNLNRVSSLWNNFFHSPRDSFSFVVNELKNCPGLGEKLVIFLLDDFPFLDNLSKLETDLRGILLGQLVYLGFSERYTNLVLMAIYKSLRNLSNLAYRSFGLNALAQIMGSIHNLHAFCFAVASIKELEDIPDLYAQLQMIISKIPSQILESVSQNNYFINNKILPAQDNSSNFTIEKSSFPVAKDESESSKKTSLDVKSESCTKSSEKTVFNRVPEPSNLNLSNCGLPTTSDEDVLGNIQFILNTVAKGNIEKKNRELQSILSRQHYDFFAQEMIMNRIGPTSSLHKVYIGLVVDNEDLYSTVLKWTYFAIRSILVSESITQQNECKLLQNLGNWLGLLTLARNKPILQTCLPLKELILRALVNDLLFAIVPMASKILMGTINSLFRDPNPWTAAILRVYKALVLLPKLANSKIVIDIELCFKNLGLNLATYESVELVPNMSWKNMPLLDKPPGYVLSLPSQMARQSSKPTQTSDTQDYDNKNFNMASAGNNTVEIKNSNFGANSLGKVLPEKQRQPRLQTEPTMNQGPLMPNLIQNPVISALFDRYPNIKQVLHRAFEMTLERLLPSIVERVVSLTTTTSKQLVTKDFALESDPKKYSESAFLMTQALSSSFAGAVAKPFIFTAVESSLSKFVEVASDALPALQEAIELNLELAVSIIQKIVVSKALSVIEVALHDQIEIRTRIRGYHDQPSSPNLLLELQKPRPYVYEGFRREEKFDSSRISAFQQNGSESQAMASMIQQVLHFIDLVSQQVAILEIPIESWPDLPEALKKITIFFGNKPNLIPEVLPFIFDILKSTRGNSKSIALNVEIWHLLVLQVIVSRAPGTVERIWEQIIHLQLHRVPDLLLGFIHWQIIPANWVDNYLTLELEHILQKIIQIQQQKTADQAQLAGTQQSQQNLQQNQLQLQQFQRRFVQLIEISAHLVKVAILETKWLTISDFQKLLLFLEVQIPSWLEPLREQLMALLKNIYRLDQSKFNSEIELGNTPRKSKPTTFNRTIEEKANYPQKEYGYKPIFLNQVLNNNNSLENSNGIEQSFDAESLSLKKQHNTLLQRQQILKSSVPISLLTWFSDWVGLFQASASQQEFSDHLKTLISQGLITVESTEGEKNTYRGIIEASVLSYLLFSHYRHVVSLKLQNSSESATSDQINALSLQPYSAVEACAQLIILLFKNHKDASFLPKFLKQLNLAMMSDSKNYSEPFNPRPYHYLIIKLISLLESDLELENSFILWLAYLSEFLCDCAPTKITGFSFAWLDILSHRTFLPCLLKNRQAWPVLHKLLLYHLEFMEPYLAKVKLSQPINLLYEGTLRVFLVLLHDCPEFLVTFHHQLCDVLPPTCIQLRNVVLSAFPLKLKLPEPTSPFSWDQLSLRDPPLYKDFVKALIDSNIKDSIDLLVKQREHSPILDELPSLLLLPTELAPFGTSSSYNIPLINSLVLYISIASHVLPEQRMRIFRHLIDKLDNEGCYHFINTFFNQLRYPNTHTYLFLLLILSFWGTSCDINNPTKIQLIIARVFIERLSSRRPLPWGLFVASRELSGNPKLGFANFLAYAKKMDPDLNRVLKDLIAKDFIIDTRNNKTN